MLKCKGQAVQESPDPEMEMGDTVVDDNLKAADWLASSYHGSRLAPAPEHQLRGWRFLPRLDSGPSEEDMGPQPMDPLVSCKVQERGMKVIHQARLLVPELIPKLAVFMFVKLLLLIPVILLGVLGFCWGKDLFARLGQGYGTLGATQQPNCANEIVMQQPFAFSTVAQNFAMQGAVQQYDQEAELLSARSPEAFASPMSSPSAPEVDTAAQE